MSQVAFLVNTPNYSVADSPTYVRLAEEVVRLVKKQLPIDDNVSLSRVVVGATDLFEAQVAKTKVVAGAAAGAHTVTGITASSVIDAVYILNLDPTPTIGSVAGGAAGDLTVTGVATTSEIKSVVAVDDTTHAVTDLTAEFTAGLNKINNVGGTATTGQRVVVTYHGVDTYTLTNTAYEYVATADTITNTGGTTSAGKLLVVIWH